MMDILITEQVTPANAGLRPAFRSAVHDLWPDMAEFTR